MGQTDKVEERTREMEETVLHFRPEKEWLAPH
jgi:hypothetical protein